MSSTPLAGELDQWLRRLFPITRSLTGPGNRETLALLQELIPLQVHEVASGTQVFDWVVPDEWAIRDAYIAGPDGSRIVDFRQSNLHVVSYSEPVRARLSWAELKPRIHRHPELPEGIPYRTSYYRRTWGFCVTHAQYFAMEQAGARGELFDVVIDSDLGPGSLTYGDLLISGRSPQEILISCYICHPSLANDNLSGVLLTAFLARALKARADLQYSYRVVFVPETIGAIAYLSEHEAAMKRIDVGLVVTTVGGRGPFGYKQSWDAAHPLNGMIEDVFLEAGVTSLVYPFDIHGSDERQYSSQGFRINAATICRDRYYEYGFYHSSFDDLNFVTGQQIAETMDLYVRLIDKLEARRIYKSRFPDGEVMLSRHELYPASGGAFRPKPGDRSELDQILWLLFLCDGRLAIGDIAARLRVPPTELRVIADQLVDKGLLDVV